MSSSEEESGSLSLFNKMGFRDPVENMEQAKKSTFFEAGSSSEVLDSIDAQSVKQEHTVGSVAKTEERVGNLLGQLLSHDGDGAIKPVNVQNLSLPCNAPGGNMPDRSSAISDVHSAFKGANGGSPKTPSLSRDVTSPTISDSLMDMTASLKKHFSLLSRAAKDLFPAQEIPTWNSFLTPKNKRKPHNDESNNLSAKFEDAYSEQLSSFVDDSSPVLAQTNAMSDVPEVPVASLEQPIDDKSKMGTEKHTELNCTPKNGSQKATKKISKARAKSLQDKCKTTVQPRMHNSDTTLRKHSLSVSGTSWEDGVRRTTRIRTRPLEYWRGERLLFGRVDKSLVTVIGKKYMSSEDEQPDFKVESYVSKKHKNLVEKAASH